MDFKYECFICKGTGKENDGYMCMACNGRGWLSNDMKPICSRCFGRGEITVATPNGPMHRACPLCRTGSSGGLHWP
jgi:hypothetical protein